MKVQDFITISVGKEGKKKQVAIAQARELAKVQNKMLDGAFYKLIRALPDKDTEGK